jgi:hypothetical protein
MEHSRMAQAMQSQEQKSMSLDEANSVVTRMQEELRLHEQQSSGPYPLKPTVKPTTEVVQAIRMVTAHRIAALYPDGNESRLTVQLTPEQIARVESLMKVPMHKLELDDRLHRETLACQREHAALAEMPFHKERIAKNLASGKTAWDYWNSLFGSQVNFLRPPTNSSTSDVAPPPSAAH